MGNGVERIACLGGEIVIGAAASDGNAQVADAVAKLRGNRLRLSIGTDRIVGVVALHHIVARSQICDRARERADVIEAGDERKCALAREAAGPRKPGHLENAGSDGHGIPQPTLSCPLMARATCSCPQSMARLVGMPLTALAIMSAMM